MKTLLRLFATGAVVIAGAGGLSLAAQGRALAGGGCHSSTPTSGTGTTVDMAAACFTPNVLHVKLGDTVTWTSREDLDHTVTGTAGSFGDYNPVTIGQSVSYRFTKKGVYPYFCLVHPGMAAAIVVGDGSGSGPAEATSVVQATPPALAPAAVSPVATSPSAAKLTDGLLPWGLLVVPGLLLGLVVGLPVGRRLRRAT
ncbi:MAG: plastocyanin/azurin family copper-binding protein [Candidatus Dormibacteraeota bacterium]|nr:plastocyanin/azurin family copper-binding protein [Candidatus Dormibacteraeota bacterium]